MLEYDDEYSYGQMVCVVVCYVLVGFSVLNDGIVVLLVLFVWLWDQQWWKLISVCCDLVKVCVLVLVEIECLDWVGIL